MILMCKSYVGKLKQDGGVTERIEQENMNEIVLKEEQTRLFQCF